MDPKFTYKGPDTTSCLDILYIQEFKIPKFCIPLVILSSFLQWKLSKYRTLPLVCTSSKKLSDYGLLFSGPTLTTPQLTYKAIGTHPQPPQLYWASSHVSLNGPYSQTQFS